MIAVILIVGLYGYVLIDSFQRTRGGQALHFHLIQRKRILVPLLGFFLFVNSFFSEHKKIQSYVVPSVSMCPGVHTGDRLFVEKNASYVRGKVYVHALPSDPSVVFIKRLIGLPGDKISIRNGDLFINEKSVIVSKQPVGNQLKDGCSQRLLGELADISKTEAMIY
ncbi:MAG: signal peptidase I [Bdellovibrionales bacterium]